jgi:predicted AAA+ superfamily ATPase
MKKELWMRMITESRNRKMTAYIPRDLVVPLDSNKIISIIGSRRSGKTTYLLHIMDLLKRSQIPAENIIYINLENPSLLPYQ